MNHLLLAMNQFYMSQFYLLWIIQRYNTIYRSRKQSNKFFLTSDTMFRFPICHIHTDYKPLQSLKIILFYQLMLPATHHIWTITNLKPNKIN